MPDLQELIRTFGSFAAILSASTPAHSEPSG